MKKKRIRNIRVHIMLSNIEREQLKERMAEIGSINMSGFIRRMTIHGYALHVDISPLHELVSLQRRCVNNLNQIAKHVNTEEFATLQKDYAVIWGQLAELLNLFAAVMKL